VGAAYDAWAFGTRYGDKLRRPPAERTPENKVKAISFAAYAALVDLFPARAADFALQMKELGYAVDGSDTSTPATIGAMVAKAVTDFRHKDRSNQLGGYADTTGYQPVNTPDKVVDPWRWQPLRVLLGDPHGTVQKALTPQWATIVPFALSSQFGHDVPGPPRLPNGEFSTEDIETLAKETRRQAVLHPGQRPDGREHRGLGVEVQVRLRAADHRHPRALPGQGHRLLARPLPRLRPGPPFPEYVSGHSTFSGAGARVISTFFGADAWNKAQTYIRPFPTGPILS
jgi:hypothetical protein